MKFKIKVTETKTIDIGYVHIDIPIRDEERDLPLDFPGRYEGEMNEDRWQAVVEMATGRILCWPENYGAFSDFHVKACDAGVYALVSPEPNMKELAKIESYVPHGVVPGEFGDYVILDIDKDGVITNWPEKPDVSEFFPVDE